MAIRPEQTGMTVKVTRPPQPRLLTVEEWVQRPDADQYELIDGFLRVRMVNQNQHEFAVLRLAYFLTHHLIGLGSSGRVLGSNTKYRVRGRRGIMPDVSVLLGAKASSLKRRAAYNTVGPDLAVEVLSPDQGLEYVEERLDDYWKLGTDEVWIADPEAETLTGYARQDRNWEIFATARGDEEFESHLLPGLRFSVSLLWLPE
jgi:Uma2 family endonuclease